jgi:hypothetical protein
MNMAESMTKCIQNITLIYLHFIAVFYSLYRIRILSFKKKLSTARFGPFHLLHVRISCMLCLSLQAYRQKVLWPMFKLFEDKGKTQALSLPQI